MMDSAWQAEWIWNSGEASPRNEWRCFRKKFNAPLSNWDQAHFKITADSRYVLYINGHRLGRGPVRSWPFEQSYDTYDIGHLINKEKPNTIAVLVNHYGVSNFYYIRGRGGLLAQLDFSAGEELMDAVSTDHTWKTSKHLGQHVRSPRMSCQQSFSEFVEASRWDDTWVEASFDDASWEPAVSIGPVGMEPWTALKKRDIPPLTEEPIYPVRVERLSQVKSFTWSAAIDLRNHMVIGSEEHANVVGFTGYVATVFESGTSTHAILGFTNSAECFGACSLNGSPIDPSQFYGVQPERYVEIQLNQGDNLFLMDVTTSAHAGIMHIGVYCESPLELKSPIQLEGTSSPFLTIGPFDTCVYLDHQEKRVLDMGHPQYIGLLDRVKSSADLAQYTPWLREINSALISEADVLSLSIWNKEEIRHNIPTDLHNMVIPHSEPADIPIYNGYDTAVIVDFGKELSGYISFEVDAEEGAILDFYGFEYMTADYRQDTFGLDNTLRYICKKGRQVHVSPIRRGFRYLMMTVRNAVKPVKIYEVKLLQSNYPIAEIGKFQCSDPLLNDIWQISQHTTRLCMEDTFVDCPAFEQVFWVGDSRNEALVSNYLFGVNDIIKRCLRLVPGSKSQTPLYSDQVPSGWSSVIPNWTFFWAIACYEYYQQTADREFAQEMYPHIKFTLEHYLAKIDSAGLFNVRGWNLLDWSPIDQPNEGIVTHQNLFLVKTLVTAGHMAALAGDSVGTESFNKAAQTLKAAINQHLWSEETQTYIDCIHADGRRSEITSMQTQVVAFLTGVAEGHRRERIKAYLLNPPENYVQIGSPFMSFFYYEALSELGQAQKIIEDIRLNYGQMIENGATTCWEMYPNFSENRPNPDMLTRSHCHAWSSAPAYFLGVEVLGVRLASPGWTEVIIAPNMSGLTWARGSVPLPGQGRIDVSWRVDEQTKKFTITIEHPKAITVTVQLPSGYQSDMKVKEL